MKLIAYPQYWHYVEKINSWGKVGDKAVAIVSSSSGGVSGSNSNGSNSSSDPITKLWE